MAGWNMSYVRELDPQLYVSHLLYIVEGSVMIVGNALIIATVLSNKALRQKEMLLFVGLALGDGTYGVGIFSGGIRRLNLTFSSTADTLMSSWECLLKFPTIFYLTGSQATAFMMVVVSLDRLTAVRHFDRYIAYTSAYFKRHLKMLGTFSLATTALAFASCYLSTETHERHWTAICLSTWAIPRWYSIGYTLFNAFGGFASIAIYAAVYMAHRRHLKTNVSAQLSSMQQIQLRRQRRLTHTLGIITLCTLLFHSIPYIFISMMVVLRVQSELSGALSPYVWALVCFNSLVNIFIYLYRHDNFRKAMRRMVCCSSHQHPQHIQLNAAGGASGGAVLILVSPMPRPHSHTLLPHLAHTA